MAMAVYHQAFNAVAKSRKPAADEKAEQGYNKPSDRRREGLR